MATRNKNSNQPDGLVSWHTCTTCGKRAYHSKADAKRSRKHHADPRLAIYRCGQWFHLGHKGESIVRGYETRAERYR